MEEEDLSSLGGARLKRFFWSSWSYVSLRTELWIMEKYTMFMDQKNQYSELPSTDSMQSLSSYHR